MPDPKPRYRSFVHDSARWEGFEFRPGDIIISTPAKCGTTWMQRICCLLVFQDPSMDQPLSDFSPWLDMLIRSQSDVFSVLEAQNHRRFIKTHTPLDGLPMDDRVYYICVGRDPRDAAVSFENHMANMDIAAFMALREKAVGLDDLAEIGGPSAPPPDDTAENRFWRWVDDPTPPPTAMVSLKTTLHHFDEAAKADDRPNVVRVHYSDLKADLEGEMRRIAGRLGIEVAESDWPALVKAATFDTMKSRANKLAPDSALKIWKDNSEFFHAGKSGQWRSFFDDAAQTRYDARVAELTTPKGANWAHHGFNGSAG